MGLIYIGNYPENYDSYIDILNRTAIEGSNPANASGIIDTIKLWLSVGLGIDIYVGTFSKSGDVFTCRDSVSLGDVPSGSLQTYSGLELDVSIGDYIGIKNKNANNARIERSSSGGTAYHYYIGECIDPGDSQTFTQVVGSKLSLYGLGISPNSCSNSIGKILGFNII
jgi:hypothetical protein